MNIWIVTHRSPRYYYGGDLSGSVRPSMLSAAIQSGTWPAATSITTGVGTWAPATTSGSGAMIGSNVNTIPASPEAEKVIAAFPTELLAKKFISQKINECRHTLGPVLAPAIEKLLTDSENVDLIISIYNRFSEGGAFNITSIKLQGHVMSSDT